ncbi:MAG: multiheme c-type cytochrome [Halodesulfurarchaeum sp.]
MNRDDLSVRVIGAIIVALVGVTVLASIGAPAAQATNAQDSGESVQAMSTDVPQLAQQGGVADCTRCHSGAKASGLTPRMCGECHTEAYQAWNRSGHAESLSEGEKRTKIMSSEECQRCHVEAAIKDRTDISFQTKQHEVKGVEEPITCEACHSPPEIGWFGHFGKGGDMLPPAGTGPHGTGDAGVAPAETVCKACHSNDVILTLARNGTISPHSTALVADVGDGGTPQTTTPPATTTSPTETQTRTPGFGPAVALLAVLAAAFVIVRRS